MRSPLFASLYINLSCNFLSLLRHCSPPVLCGSWPLPNLRGGTAQYLFYRPNIFPVLILGALGLCGSPDCRCHPLYCKRFNLDLALCSPRVDRVHKILSVHVRNDNSVDQVSRHTPPQSQGQDYQEELINIYIYRESRLAEQRVIN